MADTQFSENSGKFFGIIQGEIMESLIEWEVFKRCVQIVGFVSAFLWFCTAAPSTCAKIDKLAAVLGKSETDRYCA